MDNHLDYLWSEVPLSYHSSIFYDDSWDLFLRSSFPFLTKTWSSSLSHKLLIVSILSESTNDQFFTLISYLLCFFIIYPILHYISVHWNVFPQNRFIILNRRYQRNALDILYYIFSLWCIQRYFFNFASFSLLTMIYCISYTPLCQRVFRLKPESKDQFFDYWTGRSEIGTGRPNILSGEGTNMNLCIFELAILLEMDQVCRARFDEIHHLLFSRIYWKVLKYPILTQGTKSQAHRTLQELQIVALCIPNQHILCSLPYAAYRRKRLYFQWVFPFDIKL